MSASFAPDARYSNPMHAVEAYAPFGGGAPNIPHPPPGLTPTPAAELAAHGKLYSLTQAEMFKSRLSTHIDYRTPMRRIVSRRI
jgi:hypothetical protein